MSLIGHQSDQAVLRLAWPEKAVDPPEAACYFE